VDKQKFGYQISVRYRKGIFEDPFGWKMQLARELRSRGKGSEGKKGKGI